ncbi:hypothetical protein V6N12_027786 [Hibiscus sabdariffa]|uniref:CCHC-type domain-containing protein n=1 Tax=Hibiscus sabdariffa TaxID=183260 RepID=A0ABR2F3Z0_9ROSI
MLAENTAPNPQLSTCQLCGKYGHDAKRCWSYIVTQDQQEQAIANMIQKALKQQSWVTNSGANTHVANDVTTLNAYNDYGDELIMADGVTIVGDEKEFINDLVEIEMIEGKQATSGGVLLMNIGETRAFFTEHDGETRAIFTGLGFFQWLTKLRLCKQVACGVVFHSGGVLKCREAQVAVFSCSVVYFSMLLFVCCDNLTRPWGLSKELQRFDTLVSGCKQTGYAKVGNCDGS